MVQREQSIKLQARRWRCRRVRRDQVQIEWTPIECERLDRDESHGDSAVKNDLYAHVWLLIDTEVALADFARALARLESRQVFGKVIVTF